MKMKSKEEDMRVENMFEKLDRKKESPPKKKDISDEEFDSLLNGISKASE